MAKLDQWWTPLESLGRQVESLGVEETLAFAGLTLLFLFHVLFLRRRLRKMQRAMQGFEGRIQLLEQAEERRLNEHVRRSQASTDVPATPGPQEGNRGFDELIESFQRA